MFWSRLRSWLETTLRRSRMESDMDEELRFHIEAFTEDLVRSGMAREEALRRARMEFGGVERVKEEGREARGVNLVETFVQDIRFGLRMLRKNPGFTAVAVLTLGLGIGANTAIFSAVNSVLLRPLPLNDAERVVFIVSLREGLDPFGTSLLEYSAYKDRSRSLADVGLANMRSFNVTGQGEPERIQGAAILANYLRTLGVQPALGRSFTPEEDSPGGPAWRSSAMGSGSVVLAVIRMSSVNCSISKAVELPSSASCHRHLICPTRPNYGFLSKRTSRACRLPTVRRTPTKWWHASSRALPCSRPTAT